MKTIKPVTDAKELRVLLSLDEIKDSEVFNEHYLEGVWFVLFENDTVAGMIGLKPINNILWVPHIFIFKQYRGKKSEEWGNMVAQFMKDHVGAKKFLVLTPHDSAAKYAERMGFKFITTLSHSVEIKGQTVSQYMMEMTI